MACPGDCSSCCSTYTVSFTYQSLFTGDTYTLTRSGCTWTDNTSYANREVTLFCDSIDGWMLYAYDSAIDCGEYYITGDTTSPCPTATGGDYISVSLAGAGCYEGNLSPPGGIVDTFTASDCSSSGAGVGISWFNMYD